MKLSRSVAGAAVLGSLVLGAAAPAMQHARAAGSTPSNTLSIGWTTETKTLDPGGDGQNPDIWVMVNIYTPLLHLGPDGKTITAGLATSWSSSTDGTAYTFHLRAGAKFSDGTPVTSADVKFDLLRASNPKDPWAYLISVIKSVDTPDPSTVVINLKHPWGPFLADMTFFSTGVYPAAYFKKVGSAGLTQHPLGSGPYTLDKWVKGQYLRLVKNPLYWDAAKYPMQYIEYDLIPNDNTRLLKLQAGELDVDNVLPFAQIAAVKSTSGASVRIDKSTETIYITFNNKMKPFDDPNVRLAISHAINRAAIAKAVTLGIGTPANSFMPVGSLYYDPNIPVPAYDPKLAQQYLSKSSVPHGFSMVYNANSGDTVGNEIAQIVQQELAPLGIKMSITQTDPTTNFNNQQVGKYSSTNNLWTNDIPDPDELVSFAMDYSSGAYSFFTWYNSAQGTALSHQGENTNDAATRAQAYTQVQELWAKDQPFLALYYQPFINGVSNKVHGFSENPLGYFNVEGVTKS